MFERELIVLNFLNKKRNAKLFACKHLKSLYFKLKFSTSKFISNGKFLSAKHTLQNFLSAENFPEWKWEGNGL
jgi:hypothetical protein